ncbi:hypothetical protein N7456_002950 [Penicillium angulare]|uniref:Major facilitator superfamily (MFS) profile domain-containing protein n=1 Tax=Penicillium angulare TaxID=116970 RepID=A0A9W9KH42_9EURO|nr:hypothetical protein N7456_002950 [Penicillium angulare]
MAGTVAGPMLGGVLLEWTGYTLAWFVPMGMLFIDILCRLLIIDPRPSSSPSPSPVEPEVPEMPREPHERIGEEGTRDPQTTESSPLLASQHKNGQTEENGRVKFYSTMLRDPRILASLATSVLSSAIVAGFNATWTVHLRRVFNWGPAQVGGVIFVYQIPLIFVNPLAGYIRDRVGVRYPAAVGWALVAPLVWCLGIPGSHLPWVSLHIDEKAMFVGSAIAIGVVQPLFQDGGLLNTLEVLQSVESDSPGIFGVYGGRSRVLAMSEIAFNLGLLLGPLVTGSLSDIVGFYYASLVLEP